MLGGIVVEYLLGALVLAGVGGPVARTASAVVAGAVFGGLTFLACRLGVVRPSISPDLVAA